MVALLAAAGAVQAADLTVDRGAAPRLAASPPDWAGWYGGFHVGYAGGASNWSAASPTLPAVAGTFDFNDPFDIFKGTGSIFAGFQGGYTAMLPSRLVLGIETDVSFPDTMADARTVPSPAGGATRYDAAVLAFGSLRGRVGYACGSWLVYGTAGLAWSHDQLTREPASGDASPTVTADLWRLGWTAGAGIETPFIPGWTARLEYLFASFPTAGVTFGPQHERFDADLTTHLLRLGLHYRVGETASAGGTTWTAPTADANRWAIHGQTTFTAQYAPPFRAPYAGAHSFQSNIGRETWDATLYAGLRPWDGAEIWVNPEIDQGFGLSDTLGVAGFPSGEAYKLGDNEPYVRLHRAFLRQTIDLGGATEKVEADINQFAGSRTADRLVLTVGKFGVGDIFDTNKYAHDPRSDFLNWSIIEAGTFDYAADAWGYTLGAAAEWYKGAWTLRAGVFDMSIEPNSTMLDPGFSQFQWVGEIEHRHELWGRPGKVDVTAFLSRGRMGAYADALQLAALAGEPADIAAVRRYRSRGGVSVNLEQQVGRDLGIFMRAGIADGNVEPYEFTDIDRTVSAGLSLSGRQWGRVDDTLGLAGAINGISPVHQAVLNAGGMGILVGDGRLPHPGTERIVEAYYKFPCAFGQVTLDYQFIANPAYNRDRGPVSVIGARFHTQF
jgi:high affinity Mn2+ porin